MGFLRAFFRGWGQKSAPDFYNDGTVAATRGDFHRAIYSLTEAIRLDPKNVDAYVNRGGAYSKAGYYERAIADFTEAIRLAPNLADAYYNRALTLEQKGEVDQGGLRALQRGSFPSDALAVRNSSNTSTLEQRSR